mgnify:CR=1 FL=1
MSIKCQYCGKFMSVTGDNAQHEYQPDAWGPIAGFDYKEQDYWAHKVCPHERKDDGSPRNS